MNKIPSFSTIVVFVLFTLVGLALFKLLNFQLNPSRNLGAITVSYGWPGNEAKVVEQEVTSKLEASFSRIRGVKEINSRSENGGGVVWLSLDKESDVDVVRFEISMLVRQIWTGMPHGLSYPSIVADMPDDGRLQPLLTYTLNAPTSSQQIMQYAEEDIKSKLATIAGIGKIEIYGAEPYQWIIEYDMNTLNNLGITEGDVAVAINGYLSQEGLGMAPIKEAKTRSGNTQIILPLQIEAKQFTSLASVPIKNRNGRIINIGNVAQIKHAEAPAQSYYRINGLNTITINIFAQPGQNQIELGKTIKNSIEKQKKSFPKGFRIENSYDSNEYVERELKSITWRFIVALALLLVFVFIIYRQPKYLLLICATFVVNLSIAAICYYLFKIKIHLYSLAGITVSLGLMTDNIIVMADHLRNRGNKTVWMALLAGTMSMASILIIIFFLEEKIKASLTDFALIVIVNQVVSLITALFFVPSLMQQLKLTKQFQKTRNRRTFGINLRLKVLLVRGQFGFYKFTHRWRVLFFIAIVFSFGLPLFMLPEKWEGEKWYNNCYNNSIGSDTYQSVIKPTAEKVLGGTLRLFVKHVGSGSYFSTNEETSLMITASLPHGSTIEMANVLAKKMENYLSHFEELRTFQTTVNKRQVSINIFFKKESQNSGFPYQLKGLLISKVLEFGGAYWSVYGFGDGFSNESRESAGSKFLQLLGYNYEELLKLANKMQERLKENPRIKEVYIQSEISYFKPDNSEFVMQMNYQKATLSSINPYLLFSKLKERTPNNIPFATLYINGKYEGIVLQNRAAQTIDVWNLEKTPLTANRKPFTFEELCSIEKELSTQAVCKENQQYSIYLQFEYIGSEKFARKYIKKAVDDFRVTLPIGYSINDESLNWTWSDNMNKDQYWLIVLIMGIIFFVGSILFESLIYPFAVILLIPISFIGVFLSFYLFEINFDQGGFASFILLCGITVSAAIYIVNDYSVLKRRDQQKHSNAMKLYLKAFQYKIIPILLTISATILGFVPFLIGEKQPFWFSMATGVCGGLVFTLWGILIYLPLFLGITESKKSEKHLKTTTI